MRIARQHSPGCVFHIIWRFVDRAWFFHDDGEERERYLHLLGRALTETDWRCLSFALMSNHIHLGAVAGAASLASWSRRANAPFAHWMNERYGRIGPLFADRPSDYAMRPEGEGTMIAYVHNNPVRAGVARSAVDSSWTSHRMYLGLERCPSWLHVDEGLNRSGFTTADAFGEWVDAAPHDLTSIELAEVRRTVRRRGAIELATPGPESQVPLVARPFAHVRVDPRRFIQIVGDIVGLSEARLCSRSRGPHVSLGRRVAVHSGRAIGLSGSDIASALGVSPQGVSRIALSTLADRELCELVLARVELEFPRRLVS